MPRVFSIFALVLIIIVGCSAESTTSSGVASDKSPTYEGGRNGCNTVLVVFPDLPYQTKAQQIEGLQKVREELKQAEPILATPAAELLKAVINNNQLGIEAPGLELVDACLELGYITRKDE